MYDISPHSWYDHEDYQTKPQYLIKHCPVCKTRFKLDADKDLVAYCSDCRTDYYFTVHQVEPYKANVKSLEPKTCHCMACRSRPK